MIVIKSNTKIEGKKKECPAGRTWTKETNYNLKYYNISHFSRLKISSTYKVIWLLSTKLLRDVQTDRVYKISIGYWIDMTPQEP